MSGTGVQISGIPQAAAKLDRLAPNAQTALRESVTRKTIDLREGVKDAVSEIFDSEGPLYQSLNSVIEEQPGEVIGTVFTKDVVYAAAQEYGGTWQIPEIFPVNAKALAFGSGKVGFSSGDAIGGEMIFARHTKAHPVTLPARSYARSTLFRMKGAIVADVRVSVGEAV